MYVCAIGLRLLERVLFFVLPRVALLEDVFFVLLFLSACAYLRTFFFFSRDCECVLIFLFFCLLVAFALLKAFFLLCRFEDWSATTLRVLDK
ncbi:hypothetical protein VZ95_07280 [Elstera litoralis]|uniref:Uncharacterized protein n=1 Tax=Elstera litoralis TaxID=552518 RepID=A0A0F3ITP6_9PROT|nr:hypothetical protein VZ95_07280 [Elstera litoralis]